MRNHPNEKVRLSVELYHLLSKFTIAEEAAIRLVTPLIKFVSLKRGNVGSKGQIWCVFQQSTLVLDLPHLPTQCKMIFITRNTATETSGTASLLLFFYVRKSGRQRAPIARTSERTRFRISRQIAAALAVFLCLEMVLVEASSVAFPHLTFFQRDLGQIVPAIPT